MVDRIMPRMKYMKILLSHHLRCSNLHLEHRSVGKSNNRTHCCHLPRALRILHRPKSHRNCSNYPQETKDILRQINRCPLLLEVLHHQYPLHMGQLQGHKDQEAWLAALALSREEGRNLSRSWLWSFYICCMQLHRQLLRQRLRQYRRLFYVCAFSKGV